MLVSFSTCLFSACGSLSHLPGSHPGSLPGSVQDGPLGWSAVLPRSVLLSWVFFDRKLEGSLREQDLQSILLSLGLYLTPDQVCVCVCVYVCIWVKLL